MKTGLKVLAVLVLAAACGAAADTVLASCSEASPAANYPILQCGSAQADGAHPNWFAPPPAGTGDISAVWWQLGFGNNLTSNGGDAAGNGFVVGRGGGFIGNDSGLSGGQVTGAGAACTETDPCTLDVRDAAFLFPPGCSVCNGGSAPPGSLCFGGAASWSREGIDGCSDNDRDSATNYLGAAANDDHLNPYYGPFYGVGVYTDFYLLDAPMAVLLTESNNESFALAFFASQSRGGDPTSTGSGLWDMQFIQNGLENPIRPGEFNIVPWQEVPSGDISAEFSVPGDTSSPRILTFDFAPVQIISDNSSRVPGTPGVGTLNVARGGVGVNDHGQLVRYMVETAPILDGAGTCGAFTPLEGPFFNSDIPFTLASTVPGDTCVRLRTLFGVAPLVALPGTLTDAGSGRMGDLGYEVAKTTLIGGALVSGRINASASARGGDVVVSWNATELNVQSYQVIGVKGNGQELVLATETCTNCSNGLVTDYEIVIRRSDLKGARSLYVVSQPEGIKSNTVEVR